MRAVFLKTYKSVRKDASGKDVLVNGQKQLRTGFIYLVEGSDEEVERYVSIKGADGYERFDEETGKPLYFSNAFHGTSIGLEITQNDNVVPDTSELDAMKSLVETQGGSWSTVIEQKAAQVLNLDDMFSGFKKKTTLAKGNPEAGDATPETTTDNGNGNGNPESKMAGATGETDENNGLDD